jgi:hypothetical protein
MKDKDNSIENEGDLNSCPYDYLRTLLDYVAMPDKWGLFGVEPPNNKLVTDSGIDLFEYNKMSGEEKMDIMLKRYHQIALEESVVTKYGKDIDELKNYLTDHIKNCPDCRDAYVQILEEEAEYSVREGQSIETEMMLIDERIYLNIQELDFPWDGEDNGDFGDDPEFTDPYGGPDGMGGWNGYGNWEGSNE